MASPSVNTQASIQTASNLQFKPFDNILNFRDVGKTINDFLGEKRLVEGRLFRSARPDDASPEDRRRLIEEFNIRTIIDLRTDTEHAQRVSKHQQNASTITTSSTNPPPGEIPGIKYHLINLNGPSFSRALLFRLPFLSIIRLLSLMAVGQRVPAIRILGEGVMQQRGLIGLGYDSLEFSGKEISEVLGLCEDALRMPLATPAPSVLEYVDDEVPVDEVNEFPKTTDYNSKETQPPAILIHCTQGKDRTGLIILLILRILNIPIPAIAYDYGLSEAELVSEREARLAECEEMGLGEDFVGCAPGWVEAVVGFIGQRWGGVNEYLRSVKVGDDVVEGLREELSVGSKA